MSLWAAITRLVKKKRERRPLKAVERADGIELLVQASRRPVLRDDWPDGFDYVCGHCRKMVIASRVMDGQIWDLAFQCFRCQGIVKEGLQEVVSWNCISRVIDVPHRSDDHVLQRRIERPFQPPHRGLNRHAFVSLHV
jgi:hypothetical protein